MFLKLRSVFILILLLNFFGGVMLADNSSDLLRGNGMNFIENRGQVVDMGFNLRPDILYTGESRNMKVYLRKGGISYVMTKIEGIDEAENKKQINGILKANRIDMNFVGANIKVKAIGYDRVEGINNYYFPHCKEGITNVSGYNKIVYENVYPNIDIVFYGEKVQGLKYDIIIKPGGNPDHIKLKYSGADHITIEDGKLKVETDLGILTELMPKVYQKINGEIKDVKCWYEIDKNQNVKFKLEAYNPELETVIDPWITYYGGSGQEATAAITTDAAGNVSVTGSTFSVDFPVTTGAFQTTLNNAQTDVHVIRFDANGTRLWATYYGGSYVDSGEDVICDPSGNTIITGAIQSIDFPATTGAFSTNLIGDSDAFVVKFDLTGARIWASYYGGTDYDYGFGITSDATGDIIITGETQSSDFPVSTGAFQTALASVGATPDVYVVKFDPAGTMKWSTFLGGTQGEAGRDITFDSGNNINVVGTTGSMDFPVTPGAFQTIMTVYQKAIDAFIAKFDVNGNRLWSTYVGGGDTDEGNDIAVDGNDNISITGSTVSLDFPVTVGCAQSVFGGGSTDIFAAKFSSAGNAQWLTYQGDVFDEVYSSCATDPQGNTYVFGEWEDVASTNLPVFPCAFQSIHGGTEDQYITKYGPSGNIMCNTYIGGADEDDLDAGQGGIAYHNGYMHVTALSYGVNYPVTSGAFQTTYAGNYDLTVVKLCTYNCGDDNPILADFSGTMDTICVGTAINFNSSASTCDTVNVQYSWAFQGATISSSTSKHPSGIVYNSPGVYNVKLFLTSPCAVDSVVKNSYIHVFAYPIAAITGTTSVCNGDSAVLSASGSGTYQWSTGASTSSIAVAPTSAASYTLTVNNAGCISTASVMVNIGQYPTGAITGIDSICSGNSVTLTASGGGTYNWNTGATTTSIFISPSSLSNYSVIVSNGACTDTAYHVIMVHPLPTVAISGNILLCNGDSALLTASGATNYLWSTGSTMMNITVAPGGPTNYTVVGTNASGCSNIATIAVSVNQYPNAQAWPDSLVCEGESILVHASGGTNYLWNTGATTSSISVAATTTGSTAYTVTVSNANCSSTAITTITVVPIPIANAAGDTTVIAGNSTTISASGGTSYSWYPSTGLNCITCSSPTATPQVTTKYYVVVRDENGCEAFDSVLVIVENECGDGIVHIPNAFSPDENGVNDIIRIWVKGSCIKTLKFTIYDRWGNAVYESTDFNAAWDGKYKNKLMDAGVFVYTLSAALLNGEEIVKKGNISLVR